MPTRFLLEVLDVVENINMKKLHCRPNVSFFSSKLHSWKILHENLTKQFYKHEFMAELIRNKPCVFALQFAAIIHMNLIESIFVTLSQSTREKFSFYKLNAPNWTNMFNLSFKSNGQEAKISTAGTSHTLYKIMLDIYIICYYELRIVFWTVMSIADID